MSVEPWSAVERARILRDSLALKSERKRVLDREDWIQADVLMSRLESLDLAYRAGLPRLITSCCPFDGKPLIHTFDSLGEVDMLRTLQLGGASLVFHRAKLSTSIIHKGGRRWQSLPGLRKPQAWGGDAQEAHLRPPLTVPTRPSFPANRKDP